MKIIPTEESAMEQPRFAKQENSHSFFGNYLYQQIIPEDHFFRKLNEVIDWDPFTNKLVECYRGRGTFGRPPFDPSMILRMMLVSYLYNLSDRQTEVYVNENLPAKYFVGLAVDQHAPDHSTLTRFRDRILKRKQGAVLESLLAEIVQLALKSGIEFGSIQIMDSVHSVAHVNTTKDENRQNKGKGPRDPDARWGAKHARKFKTRDGKTVKQTEYFYGYKAHVSMNAENHLITSVQITSGEAYDGHLLPELLGRDLSLGIPVEIVTADRGYDDGNSHFLLQSKGLHSAIHVRDLRTKKKDSNKQIWLELVKTVQYQLGLKERYKIERKFGEAKQGHGLSLCRYVGEDKYAVQAFMTAIALNLKRMVKLLTGAPFKAPITAYS
jgi:IS5 family transposase